MAEGVRCRLGADVGLAVTGLTGSPAEGKSPGLVFVAAGVKITARAFGRGRRMPVVNHFRPPGGGTAHG
jgi:nicotinamide mononucleotide (NMN) deamidase PncC